MTTEQIKLAVIKVRPGLEKYLSIMKIFHKVDVSLDRAFQKAFNGFYRVRQRDNLFYEKYYGFMESNKNNMPSFDFTLNHFYSELGRIEASFSSKLVATINPDMPVWDTFVLSNLGLKQPGTYSKNRIKETVKLYDAIVNWYRNFMASDNGREAVDIFDKTFPSSGITDLKKIDLLLWQTRE